MSSITTKFAFLFLLPVFVTPAVAQGIFLTGVGAVNRSSVWRQNDSAFETSCACSQPM